MQAPPSQTLPANLEAEQAIIGSILLDPPSLQRIIAFLPPQAFYFDSHRLIYQTALNLHHQGQTPDLMAVANGLAQGGKLDQVGGTAQLSQILSETVTSVNIDSYAHLVIDKYQRRQLIEAAHQAIHQALDPTIDLAQLQERLQTKIKRCSQTDPDRMLKQELHNYIHETDHFKKIRLKSKIQCHYHINKRDFDSLVDNILLQQQESQPVYFDWHQFMAQRIEGEDWLIPGLLPKGETVLLAAQAKVGKTCLAFDASYAVLCGGMFLGERAQQGKVLMCSTDESTNSTRRRLIARGFDLLPEKENLHFLTALDLNNLSFLEERLSEFQPDLIVIDNLTTIATNLGICEKDPEFVRYIYKLKQLCQRHNVACILIHHENKDHLAKGINQISGSARIPAVPWGIWQLKAIDPNHEADPRRMLRIKPREGTATWLRLQFNFRDEWMEKGIFTFIGEMGDEDGRKRTQGQQVLELLGKCDTEGLERREIDAHLQIGRSLYQVLDRLEERKLVSKRHSLVNPRRWVYCLAGDTPPSGGEELEEDTEAEMITESTSELCQQVSQQSVNGDSTI